MARAGVLSDAQLGASQLLRTMTPPGRALGSARLQAAPAYLEREKRNKSPDVIHEVTGLWWNRDLHLSSEEEEEEAVFWQLPSTPRHGAGPEPTYSGLSHLGCRAGPRTHPAATQLLPLACWVLGSAREMPDPKGLRRCPSAALYPVQELIRGCHGRHRVRQRTGRLFAHWPPALLLITLSFTATAPQPSHPAPQLGR